MKRSAARRSAAVVLSIVLACASARAAPAPRVRTVPAPRVRVEPARLVLGAGGASAQVALEDAPLADASAPPRWSATLGAVLGGRYTVTGRRAPGWAIVGVAQGDARVAAIVALVGQGALPTTSQPGALVTVEIEGKRFGPLAADARGEVAVPVEVPPEAAVARVLAVDAGGFSTAREIPLPVADFPRALVLAPAALEAGATGTVTIFAITFAGAWRAAAAPPPELDLPPGLEATGPVRANGPGRWDVPVRARPEVADAAGLVVGARVDGVTAVATTLSLRARPLAPPPPSLPPPAAARPRPDLALRVGGASAFADFTSWTLATELAWPLGRRRQPELHLALGAGLAGGQTGPFEGSAVAKAEALQLEFSVGIRLRFPIGARLRAETGAGFGWAFADATTNPKPKGNGKPGSVSEGAPLLYAGGALSLRLGPGEALLDARWVDVRLSSETRIAGVALGLAATLGYRIGL